VQGSSCLATTASGTNINLAPYTVRYFHTDHLGSVTAITDETGLVVERLAYDAWGKRRFTNGTADVNDTVVGLTTDRGYTEHEELDELGIIHMNGRIYDPYIGRFMSADPTIQAPYELQSHNRYAYVMNNPLLYTDPSGYSWWTRFRGIVITVVAAIADAYGCAGYCSQAVQYYNAAKSAYNFAQTVQSQGWGAALKGAAISAAVNFVAQQAFGWSGDTGMDNGDYGIGHYAATAVAGCVTNVAGGGKCGQGAISAIAGLAATQMIDSADYEQTDLNKTLHHAAVQIAGGLTLQAIGGSFANGAQTASYGYLYNAQKHRPLTGAGHHKLTNQTARNYDFSKEALDVFDAPISEGGGRMIVKDHNYGDNHNQYNKDLASHTEKYLSDNKIDPKTMSTNQAKDLIKSIDSDPKLRQFNLRVYTKEIFRVMRITPPKGPVE
jgi:RHS repeat-associated protein